MVRLFYKYKASNRKYVAGKRGQIKVTGWVLFITFYVVVGPLFFARMYSVSHLYAVKPLSKWMASLAWHSMLCFILGGSFVHFCTQIFQYLILMIWRPCDLNLVMISSLASKCQDFKFGMPVFQPFYEMKLKTSKFKVLAFWSQWRYHDQIQITRSLYHKNQILKC